MGKAASAGARSRARELIVQALYQRQFTDHDSRELISQFREREEYRRADQAYFEQRLEAICGDRERLEATIAEFADRPLAQLDPVELAILLLGVHELTALPELPYRVVINEGVLLAKRFGAEDGHKYVNA
ncbi:MAG: transcription antitermination factor NusB, partial [Woeseiaceae bacterium]